MNSVTLHLEVLIVESVVNFAICVCKKNKLVLFMLKVRPLGICTKATMQSCKRSPVSEPRICLKMMVVTYLFCVTSQCKPLEKKKCFLCILGTEKTFQAYCPFPLIKMDSCKQVVTLSGL